MSYTKCVYLYCDGGECCPLQGICWNEGAGDMTVAEQRALMLRDDWLVAQPGGLDYCPDCAERLKLTPGVGDAEK